MHAGGSPWVNHVHIREIATRHGSSIFACVTTDFVQTPLLASMQKGPDLPQVMTRQSDGFSTDRQAGHYLSVWSAHDAGLLGIKREPLIYDDALDSPQNTVRRGIHRRR